MRFASLGSGSQGNATLVAAGDTQVLVDCGFTRKEAELRFERLSVDPSAIDAILVTHEHSDHCAGVAALSRRYGVPVYMTHGTARSGKFEGVARQVLFNAGDRFVVGDVEVDTVPVPHDAREPVQFCFGHGAHRLGILTDLGSLTPHVISAYGGCTGLLLEFNHDLDMLHNGPYPISLKRRVAGDYGHLNNQQAVDFLLQVDTSRLQVLVAGHLSLQNNSPEHASAALSLVEHRHSAQIYLACQSAGFDWLDLSVGPDALASAASGS